MQGGGAGDRRWRESSPPSVLRLLICWTWSILLSVTPPSEGPAGGFTACPLSCGTAAAISGGYLSVPGPISQLSMKGGEYGRGRLGAQLPVPRPPPQPRDWLPRQKARPEDLNIRRTAAQAALSELSAEGQARRLGAGKRNDPFRYWNPQKVSAATPTVVAAERNETIEAPTGDDLIPSADGAQSGTAEELEEVSATW